jgi:hypothetical protein
MDLPQRNQRDPLLQSDLRHRQLSLRTTTLPKLARHFQNHRKDSPGRPSVQTPPPSTAPLIRPWLQDSFPAKIVKPGSCSILSIDLSVRIARSRSSYPQGGRSPRIPSPSSTASPTASYISSMKILCNTMPSTPSTPSSPTRSGSTRAG